MHNNMGHGLMQIYSVMNVHVHVQVFAVYNTIYTCTNVCTQTVFIGMRVCVLTYIWDKKFCLLYRGVCYVEVI